MPESFFLLLSAGILLAVAVPRPRDVTLQWLRLGGILSIAFAGLSMYFAFARRDVAPSRLQAWLYGAYALAVLGQLGFVQVAFRSTQRAFCAVAVVIGSVLAPALLMDLGQMSPVTRSLAGVVALAAAGMVGLVLMDMLLGHAYLTASKMTIAPFVRLNRALALVTLLRVVLAVAVAMLMLGRSPIEFFWDRFGVLVATRWFVGLLIPAILVYMAHDCIKRRSTQSATGILYVTGVLIFIGELVALHLVRETRLPF